MLTVIIYCILVSYIISAVVAGIIKAKKTINSAKKEEEKKAEAWAGVVERVRESEEAERVLRKAYEGMKKQGAAGVGIYIPALLRRAFNGEDITKDEAYWALRLTYEETQRFTPKAEYFAESMRSEIAKRYDYTWLWRLAESIV